jgi:hypothetical protein
MSSSSPISNQNVAVAANQPPIRPPSTIFAGNGYSKAIGLVARGERAEITTAMTVIVEAASRQGVRVHPQKSAKRMWTALTKNPHIDYPTISKVAIETIFKGNSHQMTDELDLETRESRQPAEPLLSPPTGYDERPTDPTQINFADCNFSIHNPTQIVNLRTFTDGKIFEGAIEIPENVVLGNESKILRYGNVQYNGAAPNIKLDSKLLLNQIFNSSKKIDAINTILARHGLNALAGSPAPGSPAAGSPAGGSPNIGRLSSLELIREISSAIRNITGLHLNEKEALLERITKEIIHVLIGHDSDIGDQLLLDIDKNTPLVGRNYALHGKDIPMLTTYHATHDPHHSTTQAMPLDRFIQQGGADCRGTNCLFALLLNGGYRELNSGKEARILYAKVKSGQTPDEFNAVPTGEDHNMVLVMKPGDPTCYVKDAYFSTFDEVPVHELLTGGIINGRLAQIVGATTYPPEQRWQ